MNIWKGFGKWLRIFRIQIQIQTVKGKVLLSSASEAIQSIVPAQRRIEAESPIMKLRIIKNDVEAQKMREAHKRDAASIIKYLYWLETEIDDQNITEIKGADKLKSYKRYTWTAKKKMNKM